MFIPSKRIKYKVCYLNCKLALKQLIQSQLFYINFLDIKLNVYICRWNTSCIMLRQMISIAMKRRPLIKEKNTLFKINIITSIMFQYAINALYLNKI